MKGGHLHETTKAWITLVQVRTTAVLQCVVTVTMQPLQAVCSGMKLGYTAEEGAGRGEEEPGLQDTEAEQETSGWRRTVPGSSNRLIDKRQALTHDQQVSGLS